MAHLEPSAAGRMAMTLIWTFQQKVISRLFAGDTERFFELVQASSGLKTCQRTVDASFERYKKLSEVVQKLRKCARCGAQGARLKRCSGCRRTFYCGLACQRQHWSVPRPGCRPASPAAV